MKPLPPTPSRTDGQYHDVCDLIEFAKAQGLKHFKLGELEFSFEMSTSVAPETKKNDNPVIEEQTKMPAPLSGMPADDQLLFASVENMEFIDPNKRG